MGYPSRMEPENLSRLSRYNEMRLSGSTQQGEKAYREIGSPGGPPQRCAPVAAAPQLARLHCHNLHGVKSRGISASKVWRDSTDEVLPAARSLRSTFCVIHSYLIPSKAHDFCYPGQGPGERHLHSLAETQW